MITVIVEHPLNEEGRAYFPQWLREVRAALLRWPGFIALERLEDLRAPRRCALLLRFRAREGLEAWASSPAHDAEVAKLDPYREAPLRASIYATHPV